jgi:glycosyltransferase involved in cell wall biosynthesis
VVPGLVEHGRNGLIVAPGDVSGLARAIDRALRDSRLAARLRAAARPSVEGYGWESVALRMQALYDEVSPAGAAAEAEVLV